MLPDSSQSPDRRTPPNDTRKNPDQRVLGLLLILMVLAFSMPATIAFLVSLVWVGAILYLLPAFFMGVIKLRFSRPSRIRSREVPSEEPTGPKKKKKNDAVIDFDGTVYRVHGSGTRHTELIDLPAGDYRLRYWFPANKAISLQLYDLHNQTALVLLVNTMGTDEIEFDIRASRYQFEIERPYLFVDPHRAETAHWRFEFERL